jgi:hypothetical protein
MQKPTSRMSLFPTPSGVPGFFLTVTHNLHRNLPPGAHLSKGASRNPAFQGESLRMLPHSAHP